MAFMMPVVKNDWDIYHSQRTRRPSECASEVRAGRARKISETRSEGGRGLPSAHRSAPTMRSASYCRATPSRTSLRHSSQPGSPVKSSNGSSPSSSAGKQDSDKFHNRIVDKLKRALCRSPEGCGNAERST